MEYNFDGCDEGRPKGGGPIQINPNP